MNNLAVHRFFVLLGRECNLQCKYCIQHDIVNDQLEHKINPKIYDFINAAPMPEKRRQRVTFYGGEPLLFWKQVLEIHAHLKHSRRNFSFISNGKALTQEMVDYINANKMHLTISWDGKNSIITRGFDAVKERRELLLQVNDLCLSGVISNLNYPLDFVEAIDEFQAEYFKVNRRYFQINTDIIYNNCGNCNDLVKVDLDEWRRQMLQIKKMNEEFLVGERYFTHARSLTKQYTRQKYTGKEKPQLQARCGNGRVVQNIDMDGNLYLCHNSGIKIGTVDDNLQDIFDKANEIDPIPDIYNTECVGCDMLPYCKVGCMLMPPGVRKTYYCDLIHASFEPFLISERRKSNG